MSAPASWDALVQRLDALLQRIEAHAPRAEATDWSAAVAFRWRREHTAWGSWGRLQPLPRTQPLALSDLLHLERAKAQVCANTEQFLRGLPANHVLLTGARGTGKSSLVKACLHAYADQGLRLIEVDKADLVDLDQIMACVAGRPEKFIVFCDDLSFEAGETGYKALKVALDGSLAAPDHRLLIYATSNRRHLLPQHMADNLAASHTETGEVHPGETTEEKNALAERFGLWIPFYPLRQDDYLEVVAHALQKADAGLTLTDAARTAALRWALERGSRSARVAAQFARDWIGRQGLGRA